MKKLNAYPVYLILSGADGMISSIIFTVNMIYQVTVVGLNPLQLVLVGTTLEATAFLFEIPTGVVADVYSRRLSIIIGTVMMGFGFVLEGSIPRFETILLAQVIWGLGYTFTSGATQCVTSRGCASTGTPPARRISATASSGVNRKRSTYAGPIRPMYLSNASVTVATCPASSSARATCGRPIDASPAISFTRCGVTLIS